MTSPLLSKSCAIDFTERDCHNRLIFIEVAMEQMEGGGPLSSNN